MSDTLRSLLGLADDTPWKSDGLCAQTDPEIFFPESGQPSAPARKVCGGCPVLGLCRDHAVATAEPHGIWGGLTVGERRLRRLGITVTIPDHKRCPRCSETKPEMDFGRNVSRPDGLAQWCRRCTSGYEQSRERQDTTTDGVAA